MTGNKTKQLCMVLVYARCASAHSLSCSSVGACPRQNTYRGCNARSRAATNIIRGGGSRSSIRLGVGAVTRQDVDEV